MVTTPEVALEPVRRALLEAARDEAGRVLAAARADAARALERAAEEQRAIRREARGRGEAEGRRAAAATARHTRRQGQAAVLRVRREAYAQLRRQVLARLGEVRGDPTYPEILRQLTGQARTLLGPGARVAESPAGGIVAEAEGRRLELTLPVLADQAVEALGADLEGLWAP